MSFPALFRSRGESPRNWAWRGLAVVLAAVALGGAPPRAAADYIAINPHPSGFTSSVAQGVSDGQQVGWGAGPATGNQVHALLWAGSAASVVDLHAFLPPGFTSSQALGIDADGNIVGVASGPASGGLRVYPESYCIPNIFAAEEVPHDNDPEVF